MTAPIKNLRVIPRENDFLDRKIGSSGEIFYDRDQNTLRLYNGNLLGGISLAKATLANVSNADFLAKSIAAGIGGGGAGGSFELTIAGDDSTVRTITSGNVLKFVGSGGITTAATVNGELTINGSNTFSTIVVAGQSNVVADSGSDSLTLVAGNGIAITTNPSTDTITITAAGGGAASDSFATIAVEGQSSVVADSATDTLTLVAGTGISITTNATTDTVTINSTVAAGATAFTGLSDAVSASLTIDKIYLPAITMLVVTNNGASSYRFDQYGASDDPTIFAINGTTIAFNLQATGHPFLIQDGTGANYNTGLVHVSTAGVVSSGSSAQGKDSGTLYWKIPDTVSGSYRYQCSVHAAMIGTITVKNFGSI
jgi:plastocyanin